MQSIAPPKPDEEGQYPKEPTTIVIPAKQVSKLYSGIAKGPIDAGVFSEESASGATVRTIIPKV